MNAAEYSRQLYKEEPSYKGNEITKCCKDFLQGLLAKKIKKSGFSLYTRAYLILKISIQLKGIFCFVEFHPLSLGG